MIDKDGYRANVGIILANGLGKVFWGRRVNQDAWQFPQGGIGIDESPTQAMYRELDEEIGIQKNDVKIIAKTRQWLHYNLPTQMIRQDSFPRCIGQKQRWFLLLLHNNDSVICLDHHQKPEFDHWQWVSYWYPLNQVIAFKRDVYQKALCELSAKHSQLMGKTLC